MAISVSEERVIDEKISAANRGLGDAPVAIERRGKSLYLRATLPPRPDKVDKRPVRLRGKWLQQAFPLKVKATPKGIRRALGEARKMAAQLDLKEFSWDLWIDIKKEGDQILGGDAVERFARYKQELVKGSTWDKVYKYALRAVPKDRPLEVDQVRALIEKYPTESRMRQTVLTAYRQLLTFNEIAYDFSDLNGTYKLPVNPRYIPSDEEIARVRNAIKNPGHQYVFGLLAAYGLRDHEAFLLDPKGLKKGRAIVLGGKTEENGPRQVWPYYPEWWEKWELWDYSRLPKYKARFNSDYGQRVTQFFARSPVINFVPYALRDRWSLRTLEFDVPVELAARQMGHSLEIHTQKYHFWIDEATQERIHQRVIKRSDRPQAPPV